MTTSTATSPATRSCRCSRAAWRTSREEPPSAPRPRRTPAAARGKLVKVISGTRRSGKTYRLFQEMDRLLAAGVPRERICYFNFEDDRLGLVTPSTGDEVLEAIRYRSGDRAAEERLYLFFDEIQEMRDWGRWLRRIDDTTKATIYVSGSSSKLLSREISSEFRGRALECGLRAKGQADPPDPRVPVVPIRRGG